MYTNTKNDQKCVEYYIYEWNWVHPEREDDSRRHHNDPGANRTIDTLTIIYYVAPGHGFMYGTKVGGY
jgi:hypothetical protein